MKLPLTLLTLPYEVKDQLLKYLDIKSMEALSKTCSDFDLMINGRFLTSLNLPFDIKGSFMTDIKETEVIEKKPLLRLEFRKPESDVTSLTGLHPIFQTQTLSNDNQSFIIKTQLNLLSLKNLREVNLLPQESSNL